MARLWIDGQVGISELGPVGLPRVVVSPNPFRRTTTVWLADGTAGGFLQVRDATGRRVRDLRLSESGNAIWDGRDQDGRRLPAGAYFIEARVGVARQVARVLIAR
jgi:hypothetical protein